MGNCDSTLDDWKFVGRDKEMQEIKELTQKKQSVLISGMKRIGKSKFIFELYKQLLENKQCIWKSFDSQNIDMYECFQTFFSAIDATKEEKELENRYISKTIACYSCQECQNKHTNKCLNQRNLIDTEVTTLIKCLQKCPREIVLFLDNVEKIIDSPLKDSFLSFLSQSLRQTKLRTVLASTVKVKVTLKSFASLELKPLDKHAILNLLFEYIEEMKPVSADEEDVSTNDTHSPELMAKNKIYMEVIACLCEGVPSAAIMTGLRLIEENYLFTPANMIEILIRMRLEALSPNNSLPEERLDISKKQMEEVKEENSFFNALNENTTGTTFSVREAVTVAKDTCSGVETEAMVKQKILKKAIDRSILSVKSLPGEHQLKWHGLLRECQNSLKSLDKLPEGDKAKDMVMKFMELNVKNAGLPFDKEILSDPKSLERAIKSLSLEESVKRPVQAQEGKEKRYLSILEEHTEATEMFGAEQSEQSEVLKVQYRPELHKDLENSPDYHSNVSTTKKEYRYEHGVNEHDLKFKTIYSRQEQEPMMNEAEQSTPRQLSATPRRESDSYPSTGPQAMSHIPLSTKGEQDKNINLHNHIDNPQQDTEKEVSSHEMNFLKEPFTEINDQNSSYDLRGPVSTYNQSQSNDLSIDQGNNMSAPLPFIQTHYTGDRSQINGQVPAGSLCIDRSKEDQRRRSPVAVVSPVPRRRSPNAQKHSLQDQRNPEKAQL